MTERQANALRVRTPEGIVFTLPLAGPVTRLLAWSVDLACILAVGSITAAVVGLTRVVSLDFARALTVCCYFVLSIGYGIVLEWRWRGQTVGKRLLRLRVIDQGCLRLQLNQVVVRNLLRFIDCLPAFYLVGGLACLLSRRAQRLGDIAAGTVVVRTPRVEEPDLSQIGTDGFNSLRGYPHLAARLRQRVSPQAAAVSLQALLRRESLDPVARVELFADIASRMRVLQPFPQEATDGLSDERYVRDAVEIVFDAAPRPAAERDAAERLPSASPP